MVELFRRPQTAVMRDAVALPDQSSGVVGLLGQLRSSFNLWFWAIVGGPTLIAGVYFFAIASDLYTSEVKFLVRGPTKSPASAIGALLGSSAGAGNDDTFAVHEFLMSRDAVRKLEQSNDLRTLLSRPEADIITRFPGFAYWRKDFEALYKTYGHFVSVDVDGNSGVSALEVKAYRPEDAQNLARALLSYGEQLVNDLNERARRDAIGTFEREVSADQKRLAEIQSQLTVYRISEKMLDPKTAAAGPLTLVAQLEGQLASARAQMAEVIRNSPNSPQIPLVRTRISSLEKLIADERAKITGDNNSVATSLTEYERLDLQRQLGEKMLASAVSSLESARLEAQRQQLYLEVIAQPNLADYPLYPRRFASFGTAVVTCLLAYGIAWVLIAGIREHASA